MLALMFAPGPALSETLIIPLFIVKNATSAPIRCYVMEGGPITKLVTLKPGQERLARIAPNGRVSLACPKVRDTVFGPLAGGRYEFRKVKGKVELVAAALPQPPSPRPQKTSPHARVSQVTA